MCSMKMYYHMHVRCIPSGCRIYLQVDVGCVPTWMWDVFPVDVGHVHAASHLSHVWDQPGIPTCSVGQAGPGRAKPVSTLLALLSPDRTELQRAMEHNSRLDKEILALRARVQTLDLERKAFLELVRTHQAKPTILGWLLEVIPAPKPALPSLSPSLLYAQSFQSCSLGISRFLEQ